MQNPAIVAVGYNRPKSLQRLLDSLVKLSPMKDNVKLILSIDRHESSQGEQVRQIATGFDWPHGDKTMKIYNTRQGLRQHILNCGDLSYEHGAVIVLEDDLVAAPGMYQYALDAMDCVGDDGNVAGVSLYNHAMNTTNVTPFTPLHDGYDNYYLQLCSSWGQLWTKSQWHGFKSWYEENHESPNLDWHASLHSSIVAWPESSWLKYFILYMVRTDKYFFYPRISFTTNSGETGQHLEQDTSIWQVNLSQRYVASRFCPLTESNSVYDNFFDPLASRLKRTNPNLKDYTFDVDLTGAKEAPHFKSTHVLSNRPHTSKPILAFPTCYKPMEENLRWEGEGNGIVLCERNSETIASSSFGSWQWLTYHFPTLTLRRALNNVLFSALREVYVRCKTRIANRLGW